MEQALFHVMLAGRRLGPYDRRTIVGMRIRKTLSSANVLIDSSGAQLTVADLLGRRPRTSSFNPLRTSGQSVVRAVYAAALAGVSGSAFFIPKFRGELEVRVQADVLRIAGSHRQGFRLKEDRVKLPLAAIVHAGLRGSQLELGLRGADAALQRVSLELFSSEAAAELAAWLPGATPWPQEDPGSTGATVPPDASSTQVIFWVCGISITLVVSLVLMVLGYRR